MLYIGLHVAAFGLWALVTSAILLDMARQAPGLFTAFMAGLVALYPLLRAVERWSDGGPDR